MAVGTDDLFYKNKIRKEKDLRRRKAIKDSYETIWIICEDSKSAPYYFKECIKFFKLNTANVVVVPGTGSAPISVVDHAIQTARDTSGIDRIFCVFDQDSHESFSRAIDKINAHNPLKTDKSKPEYRVVTSVPCFEVWLLLHFEYSTKSYSATKNKSAAEHVTSDLKKFIHGYTKNSSIWFDDIKNRMALAIKNAKQLERHNDSGKFINPSTNMHELIEHLMCLKSVGS